MVWRSQRRDLPNLNSLLKILPESAPFKERIQKQICSSFLKERMEEKHKDHTPLFSSPMARSKEITIRVSSTEEDIRKIYDASKMGSIQILNMLLQEDPDLIKKVSISTSNAESPLHVSILHRHLEFARLLLDHNPELAVVVDAYQQTPLHLATINGYLEMVRALLETNTSACLVRDRKGLIPLHYAVINGQIEIVQELIDARPQSVWMKLDNRQTILHLCAESNHFEAMKLLIERFMNHDEDFLNAVDDRGNTILDLSMMQRRSEMVEYLVSIPEVKTGTSNTNFSATKPSVGFKKKRSKKSRRQRQEFMSRSGWSVWLTKKLKYEGDWDVEEVQGTMMLVATVIATVTFQAGINPPGGVWQQDTPYNSSNKINQHYRFKNDKVFLAGTPIMSYLGGTGYLVYLMANTVSFLASVSVIMLIISRFPLKNRVGSWALTTTMFLAVFFLTFGYTLGVRMVNQHALLPNSAALVIFFIVCYVWLVIVSFISLSHIIRFLLWVVKSLLCTFSSEGYNVTTPSKR